MSLAPKLISRTVTLTGDTGSPPSDDVPPDLDILPNPALPDLDVLPNPALPDLGNDPNSKLPVLGRLSNPPPPVVGRVPNPPEQRSSRSPVAELSSAARASIPPSCSLWNRNSSHSGVLTNIVQF
eukprot:sb/3475679/